MKIIIRSNTITLGCKNLELFKTQHFGTAPAHAVTMAMINVQNKSDV
jgi:hypothetical protein